MVYNGGMSNTLPPFSLSSVSVGQVLYLIPKEARGVIPALVVEEIIRKTSTGTSSSLMIQLPTQAKHAKLDPNVAEIFLDINEVRKVLIERASLKINEMLDEVQIIANHSFSLNDEELDVNEESDDSQTQSTVEITLPDGIKGRISTSAIRGS